MISNTLGTQKMVAYNRGEVFGSLHFNFCIVHFFYDEYYIFTGKELQKHWVYVSLMKILLKYFQLSLILKYLPHFFVEFAIKGDTFGILKQKTVAYNRGKNALLA